MRIYEMDAQRVYTGNFRDLSPKDPIPRGWTHIAPPDLETGVAIFDGVKWFTRAERPAPVTASAPAEQRHITVGAFFDRFGDQKMAILSSTDPGVRALITDCTVREYIDLDDPQLPAGVTMLVDAGFTVDAETILSAPIEERERPTAA